MVLAPCSSSLPKLLLKPGRWTVGSAATCSYRIAADGVRPRHALVLCGGQTTVLKAWDSHTWHNGQPVRGEVRLQPGDHVTFGSVEFSIEADDVVDVAAMPPDLPAAKDPHDAPASGLDLGNSDHSLTRRAGSEAVSSDVSDTQPEGWNLERLRDQIQELRDELSQRVLRRSGAVAISQTPIVHHPQEADLATARITELEQSAAEARRLAEQAQQELAVTRAEQARREADLRQIADELRPALDAAQQDVVELRRDRDQLRSDAVQREQAWEQQTAAWSAEREQWQEDLVSLANARQQLATESEQRQSTSLDEATHWKTENEQLRAAWQLQQAAWENERSQMQTDLRRHAEAAQQALHSATQSEQESAELVQQCLAEREQIEADRQQLQTEQLQRDQAVAALAEERQHVEQHAAEVVAKFEDFTRRMTEFEQQQANFSREQQTLEHSWNWLQNDRRKLVEEKEEWQQQRAHWQAECERWIDESEKLAREREEFAKDRDLWHEQHAAAEQLTVESEQLAAQRQQLQAEQSAWATHREQFETERQIAADELEAAREELRLQQQAIRDEHDRFQVLHTEWEARSTESELEEQAPAASFPATTTEVAMRDEEASPWSSTSRLDADNDWKAEATSSLTPRSPDASPTEVSLPPLTDAWSIGVDLTAPRETHTLERNAESEITSEREPSSSTGPVDEVSSLVDLPPHDDTSTTQSGNDEDAVAKSSSEDNLDLVQPPEPDAKLDNTGSASRAEEQAIVPSTGPTVSILESMAFTEDEDVDESVSRYMQHLLARSPQPQEGERDRYTPVPTEKRSAAGAAAVAKPFSKVATVNDQASIAPAAESGGHAGDSQSTLESLPQEEVAPPRLQPVHHQDRESIRAATEQMRQVANQQTVKNVEAANWKQIRRSIKTKLVLAALSFMLSAGLLYWGYYFRPEFLILGVLTSALGVVTWLDLLLAIRQAHVRASKLTGRKKPTGKAKS